MMPPMLAEQVEWLLRAEGVVDGARQQTGQRLDGRGPVAGWGGQGERAASGLLQLRRQHVQFAFVVADTRNEDHRGLHRRSCISSASPWAGTTAR